MISRLLFALTTLIAFAVSPSARSQGPPPNIILILADDLGATDLGVTGSKFYETPNIDRLAKEGMRFTRAYSACTVCSPTRASLLTGKSPATLHVTDWIAGHQRPKAKLLPPDWRKELPDEELTLPEILKQRGYATASVGKWHLGPKPPEAHGFDVNIGGTERGQPPSYFSPYRIPTLPDGPEGEFLSDRLAAEAGRFMEANREKPFFIYLPEYAVHTPLQGKAEVIAKYKAKIQEGMDHRNATYAALVEGLDDLIGAIRTKVDQLGLTERTLIVFTSDNGGLVGGPRNPVTKNLGLRDGKGSAYEGGVRVPLIWHWPGVTKPGATVDSPVITGDIFQTLVEIAGAPPKEGAEFTSLVPALRGSGSVAKRPLHWHYPHYHPGGATPYSAILSGDWRLIEFFEDGRLELYNLAADPIEQRNLASEEQTRAKELHVALKQWREKVGAQLPVPNPAAQ